MAPVLWETKASCLATKKISEKALDKTQTQLGINKKIFTTHRQKRISQTKISKKLWKLQACRYTKAKNWMLEQGLIESDEEKSKRRTACQPRTSRHSTLHFQTKNPVKTTSFLKIFIFYFRSKNHSQNHNSQTNKKYPTQSTH